MLKFFIPALFIVTPFVSKADYCDRVKNPDGSIARVCGNEKKWIAKALCTGHNSNGNKVEATLLKQFDFNSNPTGIMLWQIQTKEGGWKVSLWAPNESIIGSQSNVLVAYYPPEYHGKYSYTGSATYQAQKSAKDIIFITLNNVVSNLRDRPLPKEISIVLRCTN